MALPSPCSHGCDDIEIAGLHPLYSEDLAWWMLNCDASRLPIARSEIEAQSLGSQLNEPRRHRLDREPNWHFLDAARRRGRLLPVSAAGQRVHAPQPRDAARLFEPQRAAALAANAVAAAAHAAATLAQPSS